MTIKMNKQLNLDYLEIAQFFLKNFSKIKDVEEIRGHFDSRITEIPKEKDEQNLEFFIENHQFIGQKHYDFKFYESNNYWGEISVDFIDDILRNVRCQLFAVGFIPNNWGMSKKYQHISELLSNNFGKPKELDYSLVGLDMPSSVKTVGWTDKEVNIFFTLRRSKNHPNIRNYISFAMEYWIENHKLLVKK